MNNYFKITLITAFVLAILSLQGCKARTPGIEKTRVIVTTDGEIDDKCSMVRFLLYANEWDIEGIVTSSSQYHWHGHNWEGDDWMNPYLDAYEKVYANLVQHDPDYPTPKYLRERTVLGNVAAEGEMEETTPGSELIVKVLLDETDSRPVWIQAWGGTNTIARALKTIEELHPEKMPYVAGKVRFFFIWEQDNTYQSYIRPHWGKYNIKTIIADQFEAIAYRWRKSLPKEAWPPLEADWMNENILQGHGALCDNYKARENGEFRSEGDSPSYFHIIPTGLRNIENPDWGGWGGRYVNVRENTWLDPVPVEGYVYPKGRWYASNAWGITNVRNSGNSTKEQRNAYFKPIWRWLPALQNDFASRADWCVMSYENANHAPIVRLKNALDMQVAPGKMVKLNAKGTYDPDNDQLTYKWWQYNEAGTYKKNVVIENADKMTALLRIPHDAKKGESIHIICEVSDDGDPMLTRYQRVVIDIEH